MDQTGVLYQLLGIMQPHDSALLRVWDYWRSIIAKRPLVVEIFIWFFFANIDFVTCNRRLVIVNSIVKLAPWLVFVFTTHSEMVWHQSCIIQAENYHDWGQFLHNRDRGLKVGMVCLWFIESLWPSRYVSLIAKCSLTYLKWSLFAVNDSVIIYGEILMHSMRACCLHLDIFPTN